MYNGYFQTLEESFRVIVTVSRLLGLLVMICINFCRYQICERCEIDFSSPRNLEVARSTSHPKINGSFSLKST